MNCETEAENKWLYEKRAAAVIKNLNRKHINAQYVSTRKEAAGLICEMVPEEARVVRGDSITLDQIGVVRALKERGNEVIDPFEQDEAGRFVYSITEADKLYRKAFTADVFLAGINGVTLDGKLVNTDGLGNRVAPIIFGPGKVILATGANKIVRDVNEARERIASICAPLDVRRYVNQGHTEYGSLPCARNGICTDCRDDFRFCCYTVIIEAAGIGEHHRINVVLVGESLGY
jgi:hypothetical protein